MLLTYLRKIPIGETMTMFDDREPTINQPDIDEEWEQSYLDYTKGK